MSTTDGYLSPGIAGSGAIALGVAAAASALGEVRLLARSDSSAWQAEERIEKLCRKTLGGSADNVKVTTEAGDLTGCDLIVEAIVEDPDAKAELHGRLAEIAPEADLATTTSSLAIAELGARAGCAERLYGLHVFNPVDKMKLIELCFPEALRPETAERARAFCAALDKEPVEVPDQAGFVVNRLLFPLLFDAVRMLEDTGLEPAAVDTCMRFGAGHPMGPLKLLDFVGIDVATAIGESLHAETGEPRHEPPQRLRDLAAEGKLGRKSGAGFYVYGDRG